MNTATLARTTATRQHLGLSAYMLRLMQRTLAPAIPPVRQLDKGATYWVAHPLGRTVSCETGTLWLTFDNEPVDVILEAGQSHRCTKDSKLLTYALAAARVSVA